jgi:hypothetical protein
MSALSNLLNLIKGDLEVDLLPVAIGALQVLQKNPSALGAGEAEAYVLGNAPAALLAGETQLLQTGINDLNAIFQKMQAAQTAAAASSPATTATLAKK